MSGKVAVNLRDVRMNSGRACHREEGRHLKHKDMFIVPSSPAGAVSVQQGWVTGRPGSNQAFKPNPTLPTFSEGFSLF